MATLVASAVVVLLIVSSTLHGKGKRVLGCWLLMPFPAFNLVAILFDLSRGAAKLGQGAFESDKRQLIYSVVIFIVSLLAALRPRWPWLFWIAWMLNAFIAAILFYSTFFWKVFN